MPLTNCPDCSNQISDKAPTCIHCGRPLKHVPMQQAESRPNTALVPLKAIIAVVALAALSAGILAYVYAGRIYRDAREKVEEVAKSEEVQNVIHGATPALEGEHKVKVYRGEIVEERKQSGKKAAEEFQKATKLFRSKNWEEAVISFQEVTKLAPDFEDAKRYEEQAKSEMNAEVSIRKAKSALQIGDFVSMKSHLSEISSSSSYAKEAREILAKITKDPSKKDTFAVSKPPKLTKKIETNFGGKQIRLAIDNYRSKEWAQAFKIVKSYIENHEGSQREKAEYLAEAIRIVGQSWILAARKKNKAESNKLYYKAKSIDKLIESGYHQGELSKLTE